LLELKGLEERYPHQLSGGQRQRVAIARALAGNPDVLLLDEPFAAVDAQIRQELRQWLVRLHQDLKITTIFVTHDQEEALSIADRVGVMRAGRLEQLGPPAEVYSTPTSTLVAEFVGSVSRLSGEMKARDTVAVLGARLAVPASAGAGLRAGQKVDVLVPPESIRMRPTPDGPAVVARASFLGAVVRVVAALPDGVEVTSTLPASEGYTFPAGARVDIDLFGDVLFVVAVPPAT